MPRSNDSLRARACSLNNGPSAKVDAGNLKRRVSEIEADWCPTANLPHTDLRKTAVPECQGLFDGANHGDLGSSIRQYDGGGCEGAENINDGDRPRRLL